MKLFKHFLLALAVVFCVEAQAQRMPVPIVDFKDVPVSASVSKPVTSDDVRKAFVRAAATLNWTLTPVSEGVMELKYVKENKHVVVAKVTYDAQRYSIAYQSSVDMKFDENAPKTRLLEDAAHKQKNHFASDPLTPYAVVPRPNAVIHPFYEGWVRHLLAAVSIQLKVAES